MNWWGWGNTLLEPAYLPPINPQTQSYQYFNRSHPDNAMWNWNYVFMHCAFAPLLCLNLTHRFIYPLLTSQSTPHLFPSLFRLRRLLFYQ